MDSREEEDKKQQPISDVPSIISFPHFPDDTPSEVVSLGGNKIAVKQAGNRDPSGRIMIFELKGSECNPISEFSHKDCRAFGINQEKTCFVSASGKTCFVWDVQEGELTFNKYLHFPEKLDFLDNIFVCKDNNHLVGIGRIYPKRDEEVDDVHAFFVFNLASGKYSQFNLDRFTSGISLLERGDRARLYCSNFNNKTICYEINFSANPVLAEPKVVHSTALRCVCSPSGEYVIFNNRDALEIFNVNQDMLLTNKRLLPTAVNTAKDALVFIDQHTIVFLTQSDQATPEGNVFKVDLKAPVLKLEKCFKLPRNEKGYYARSLGNSPFCPVPGGFLEVAGNRCVRITTFPGYELLKQAEAAIFHYYLYGTMPASTQVKSIVVGFSGPPLLASAGLFTPEGKEASMLQSQREFFNSLLVQLIRSKQFSAEDTQALKSFLETSRFPETSGISDEISKFLKKLEKLDKLDTPEFKRKG
ncbi:MAG: hypothetical protein ACYCQI_06325 [Gammaproteobacteria bacterium]